jgi:hypothetical protein
MPAPLLRIDCDFNDGDEVVGYWVLHYDGKRLSECASDLGIREGQEVLLCEPHDFEVPAILRRGRTWFGEGDEDWLAFPDWTKKVDIS